MFAGVQVSGIIGYICECVYTGAVNRSVTRACFEALIHIDRRAARMRACLLTLRAITGRNWRDIGDTASSEGFRGSCKFLPPGP